MFRRVKALLEWADAFLSKKWGDGWMAERDKVRHRCVKIRYFLSKIVKIHAMSRKKWLQVRWEPTPHFLPLWWMDGWYGITYTPKIVTTTRAPRVLMILTDANFFDNRLRLVADWNKRTSLSFQGDRCPILQAADTSEGKETIEKYGALVGFCI